MARPGEAVGEGEPGPGSERDEKTGRLQRLSPALEVTDPMAEQSSRLPNLAILGVLLDDPGDQIPRLGKPPRP